MKRAVAPGEKQQNPTRAAKRQRGDDTLIRAQRGEYVIRRGAAKELGDKTLRKINRSGKLPKKACK